MSLFGEKKGPVIFAAILVVILFVSVVAYQMTGHMGIEDRYNAAVGLPPGAEEEGAGFLGFAVEGDPVLYLFVLGILGMGCFAAYWYSHGQKKND